MRSKGQPAAKELLTTVDREWQALKTIRRKYTNRARHRAHPIPMVGVPQYGVYILYLMCSQRCQNMVSMRCRFFADLPVNHKSLIKRPRLSTSVQMVPIRVA